MIFLLASGIYESGIDNRKIIFHELIIKFFYVPEDAVDVGTAEVDVREKILNTLHNT